MDSLARPESGAAILPPESSRFAWDLSFRLNAGLLAADALVAHSSNNRSRLETEFFNRIGHKPSFAR
jgi:hypothetical protein